MKPLRVLHVVPHLDRVGGYELQALGLAAAQARRGAVEPILLTHAEGSRPLRERGPWGEIRRLPRGWRRHHPAAAWRELAGSVQLVHAHGLHKLCAQLVDAAAARGLPAVVKVPTAGDVAAFARPHEHAGPLDGDEQAPRDLARRLMLALAWRRLRRARRFLAPTTEILRELLREGLPGELLPNGVDLARFRPPDAGARAAARAALGLHDADFVAVCVARLATRKRQALLLEAWARIGAACPRARLLLVGDGPKRAELAARAARADLAGRVTLLGERADVRPVLHAADLFLTAAEREGLPNALLEAGACGLPALCSALAAHQGPGRMLVPRDDPAAWAEALRALALDRDGLERCARAAREVRPLDLGAVEQRVAAVYDDLLGDGAPAHAG